MAVIEALFEAVAGSLIYVGMVALAGAAFGVLLRTVIPRKNR